MFYIARELLQRKDIETGTHQGLVNQFGLHFVKEGPLQTRYGRMLREMQELREFAEYAEKRVVTQEDADTALQNAKEFVEEIGKLLRAL